MLRLANKNFDDAAIINQLPHEIILRIFSYLDIPRLGIISNVCLLWNELAADDSLWVKGGLTNYSPFAIERIKMLYDNKSAKEAYHHLKDLLIKTEQNLLNYYLDAWRVFGVRKNTLIPFNLTIEDKQKARFKLIRWLGKWEENDLSLAKNLSDGQVESYSDHHCKLFAAAYVGNVTLLIELINEKEPVLSSIFNFNSWDLGNYGIKVCEKNPENFPQKFSFFTKNFRFGETCLIDLAFMHDQQALLNIYYKIALKYIKEDEEIFWAIICRQHHLLENLLLRDTSFNNLIGVLREGKIVRLFNILHFAVAFGNKKAIDLLLEQGMSLPDDEASLYGLAIYRDHLEVLDKITASLIDHEIVDIGVAAKQGDSECVLQLLAKSSKSYLQDEALSIANYWNQYEVIEKILACYPHKIELFISDEEFFMPLLAGYKEIIEFILNKIMIAPRDVLLSFIKMLKDKANNWSSNSSFFHYLLKQTMQYENIELLKIILLAEFDIDGVNEEGLHAIEFIKTCNADNEIKERAIKIVQCELLIQQALLPNKSSIYTFFFPNNPELILCKAAKLDVEYFMLRMQIFIQTNPLSVICKKIKNFEIIQDLLSLSQDTSYSNIIFDA